MGVKLIRDATCDRCGKKCSSIVETVKLGESAKVKTVEFNKYHYTEIILKQQDDRFETGEIQFVLCGTCVGELKEWLFKRKTEECDP